METENTKSTAQTSSSEIRDDEMRDIFRRAVVIYRTSSSCGNCGENVLDGMKKCPNIECSTQFNLKMYTGLVDGSWSTTKDAASAVFSYLVFVGIGTGNLRDGDYQFTWAQ